MTKLSQPLEEALLGLSQAALLNLVNVRLDPARHERRWLGADTTYTLVQEVARRWAGCELQLAHAIAQAASEPVSPVCAAPEASPQMQAAPKAPKPRHASVPRAGRTIKSACKELLLAGGLTDASIFAKLQAEFRLADDKKGYVDWYRKHFRRAGEAMSDPLKV